MAIMIPVLEKCTGANHYFARLEFHPLNADGSYLCPHCMELELRAAEADKNQQATNYERIIKEQDVVIAELRARVEKLLNDLEPRLKKLEKDCNRE